MKNFEENQDPARPSTDRKSGEKMQRLIRPEALKKDEPLFWSPGKGTDVWEMFCAAINGDLQTIELLVQNDPSLVQSQYEGRTPLYFAVCEDQMAVVSFLLAKKADPHWGGGDDLLSEIARYRGYTAMLKILEDALTAKNISPEAEKIASAIRERNLYKLKTLLDASPELVLSGDSSGNQPIHWAVMTRQPDMINDLVARGADLNAKRLDGARPIQLCNGDYSFRGWRDVPENVATPREILLHLKSLGAYVDICTASHIGDPVRVRALLEEDPSLANKPSDYVTYYACSGTPLRNAAGAGHMEIVKLLLEKGADPNLPEEGIAPRGGAIYSAVNGRHYEIVKLLLEKGAYPNPPWESSADALSIAYRNDDLPMIDLLCSYGASRDIDLLAYYGDVSTAAEVFAANPSMADNPGAFQNAAGNGHEGFMRLMLHYQPNLATRISGAAQTPELTEWLFQLDMPVNHRNWLSVTPLHQFAKKGDIANAAIFLRHGADLHARDQEICSTPLAWAAKYGKIEMVDFLLQQGAKPLLPDDEPWATPKAWATFRGHTDIIRILENR
ncbi:ankyrin repeat domain-containing protein [Flavitalea sp.]|nr:ankyrin repeat domain-containing protein [Flavitalea sp.]